MSSTLSTLEDDIRAYLKNRVAEGFDSEEDIAEFAMEYLHDEHGELDGLSDLIVRVTAELVAEHISQERSWIGDTDCDRLDRVFNELETIGVVARQNFTCCQTCGHAEIWEEIEQAKQEQEVSGYVFFHQQDTERVVEEGTLYLAYGSVDSNDESTLQVAKQIVEALSKNGFSVDWNGSLDKRICVEKINWRKRRAS